MINFHCGSRIECASKKLLMSAEYVDIRERAGLGRERKMREASCAPEKMLQECMESLSI